MSSLTISRLSKSYGSVDVLHALDLEVRDGEFVAVVGPSGCGKSTLLRILAGLDEPSSGDILIDDEWVNDLTPRERNVAMVFQTYALYPHMSVAANIGFNLKIAGMSKAAIRDKVREVADILDLRDFLHRKPSALSGGERQRVAIGRALVRNPDVFLFDEPLSNLDAKLRVHMRDEIKRLHQRLGTTSVYVTHDQIEAMTLSDRLVILDQGRIEQVGTPVELYQRPANAFVAGFIGSPAMNFVPSRLSVEDSSWLLKLPDGSVLFAHECSRRSNSGKIVNQGSVLLGMRPEHLKLGAGTNTFQAELEFVEPTGAHNVLKLRLRDHELTVIDPQLTKVAPGEVLTLHIDPVHLHVFSTV